MHGAIPRPARVQVTDEELGKKSDDRKTTPSAPSTPRWNTAIPRFRKRRWAALILAMGFFYVFFKNIPQGLTPVAQRADRRVPGRQINNMPLRGPPKEMKEKSQSPVPAPTPAAPRKHAKAPEFDDNDSGPLHYYNGPIELPLLLATLQAESSMLRHGVSSSVMFAAANLQNVALLIPMICEMARTTTNVVNFAYFGRDDLPLDKIQEINGVKNGCNAIWHDARPDQSVYSSDERFFKAVDAAMAYIIAYIRPEAFLTVEDSHEEKPFIDALKISTTRIQKPVIEIPFDGSDKLMWLTRLDANSLTSWQHLDIKILIQVTKENVGGLSELLKSISTGDYAGHRYPHITFDIPADLDIPSRNVVEGFSWPPNTRLGAVRRSEITIRKRISHKHVTPLESSIRMIEDFYPTRPTYEHIMVLSSDVQLSHIWYHYLIYNVLEYGYSNRNLGQVEPGLLAGISLITPLTQLDQRTLFKPPQWTPPAKSDPDLQSPTMEYPGHIPFMWQAPDTMATLYFGHKWRELHSFLSLRLQTVNGPIPRKLQQNMAPFAEPLNELMGLRGWYVLYPNLPAHHIASYQLNLAMKEEFTASSSIVDQSTTIAVPDKDIDPYFAVVFHPSKSRFSGSADIKTLATGPIHNIISNKGILPTLRILPILDSDGNSITTANLIQASDVTRNMFRVSLGRCQPGILPQEIQSSAEDLFCDDTGDPYSSHVPQVPTVDLKKLRYNEEEAKKNALGNATPITVEPGSKEELHEEFMKHLQRQDPSAESESFNTQSETKKPIDTPSAPDATYPRVQKPADTSLIPDAAYPRV